jgi:hypothetical protein
VLTTGGLLLSCTPYSQYQANFSGFDWQSHQASIVVTDRYGRETEHPLTTEETREALHDGSSAMALAWEKHIICDPPRYQISQTIWYCGDGSYVQLKITTRK